MPTNAKLTNVSLQLSTQETKSHVIVKPIIKKSVEISHESLHDLQIGLGNLSNKMLHISNWVRTQVGRSSIHVEFDKSLQAKSDLLFDEFYAEECTFDGNGDIGKYTSYLCRM